MIVDHEISRVGARYHLILVVAANFRGPGLIVFNLQLVYRQATLRIGVWTFYVAFPAVSGGLRVIDIEAFSEWIYSRLPFF